MGYSLYEHPAIFVVFVVVVSAGEILCRPIWSFLSSGASLAVPINRPGYTSARA